MNDRVTKNIIKLNVDNEKVRIIDNVLKRYRDYDSEEVFIPQGVSALAEYSVSILNAKELHIPMSVEVIRKSALFCVSDVRRLYIENPDIYLECECLSNLYNLKEVYIGGNRVECIVTQRENKKKSFYLEKYLGKDKSYRIDGDITVIGRYSFSNCENLESVYIPNSVGNIDLGAFIGCKSLKEINIPNSVNMIHLWTFKGCTAIKELTIPQNTVLFSEAFEGWTREQTLRVPMHLKKLRILQRWRKKCKAKVVYY